jgi:ubiquinone/menaquinone biosynthesis C-methylase UbiE
MSKSFLTPHRRKLIAHAYGEVMEIGFGTGLNLPFYSDQVHRLTAVDPNPGMHRLARKRIQKVTFPVHPQILSGEKLPFEDNRFDCAVSTFTLCSIMDVDQALGEVFRVLKPAGKFLFLEHGLSPEPKVQKWQHRLNWLQVRLAGGCNLDRNIKELIARQPFTSLDVTEFYLERTPRTHSYLYQGIAVK